MYAIFSSLMFLLSVMQRHDHEKAQNVFVDACFTASVHFFLFVQLHIQLFLSQKFLN